VRGYPSLASIQQILGDDLLAVEWKDATMVDTMIVAKPARNATDPSRNIGRSKSGVFICIVRTRPY